MNSFSNCVNNVRKKKQKRTARAELKTENMLSCQVSEYSFSPSLCNALLTDKLLIRKGGFDVSF